MVTTFNSVDLPNASKVKQTPKIVMRDALLLSGKHRIQTNANMGFEATYRCFGSAAQYAVILAFVGTPYTLVTNLGTFYNCLISVDEPEESDNPTMFYFTVSFKQNTWADVPT